MSGRLITVFTKIGQGFKKNDWLVLVLVYFLIVGLKFSLVGGSFESPFTWGDALQYVKTSRYLAHGFPYYNHTSLLYSLLITPALVLFKNDPFFYKFILLINALVSSSIIFFIYGIAKRFIPRERHWGLVY